MRHIISILIENESGALSRVAGLFSARGYNIESLTVAATEDPSLSRMTLVTRGSEDVVAQITKQLNKLIDVVKLVDLADSPHIERELMMVKIKTTEQTRNDIRSVVDIFRGRILDVTPNSYVVEMTGASEKLDAFISALSPNTIIEVVRSGATGISRGEHGLHLYCGVILT
jgi:acetolactate synthase I/III small subunit